MTLHSEDVMLRAHTTRACETACTCTCPRGHTVGCAWPVVPYISLRVLFVSWGWVCVSLAWHLHRPV